MAFASHPIDGSLASWQEVTAEYDEWAGLLLGNGLSRNVYRDFGYPSLFEKARRDEAPGSLTGADRDLFLVDALNRNPERPVAVSLRSEGISGNEILSIKASLRSRLRANQLVFFDAATHPLGLVGQARAGGSPPPRAVSSP